MPDDLGVITNAAKAIAFEGGAKILDTKAPGASLALKTLVKAGSRLSSRGKISEEIDTVKQEEAWDKLDQRYENCVTRALEKHHSRLDASNRKWQSEPEEERPDDVDVIAVVSRTKKIWLKSDRKKRELLHLAMVNAFDPALYKKGINEELFNKLDELTTQDIYVLRSIEKRISQSSPYESDLTAYSIKKMVNLGLLWKQTNRNKLTDWDITELGRYLCLLLKEEPS